MGGGRRFLYPKWVWSPTGGWWPSPVAWKRNTAMVGVVVAIMTSAIYTFSEAHTVHESIIASL